MHLLSGQGEKSEETLAELQQSLASTVTSQCMCGVTPSHISEGEFSCRGRSNKTINYRARIKGTSSRSASDLVALIQSWVQSGQASVRVGSSRFHVDASCDAALDNIHALDCDTQPLTPPTKPPPTKPPSEETKPSEVTPSTEPFIRDDSSDGTKSAQVGGIILGGIIAGILLALLVLFIVIVILWKKKTK